MKRPKLMQKQQYVVAGLLHLHCTKNPDGGATYEEGWDDHRVYMEAMANNPIPDRPMSESMVQGYRLRAVGNIRAPRAPRAKPEATASLDIDALEERLDERFRKRLQRALEPVQEAFDTMDRSAKSIQASVDNITRSLTAEVNSHAARIGAIEAHLRPRGYIAPPGRPVSTPPSADKPNGPA